MSKIGGTSADAGMMRVMAIVGFALLMLALCIGLIANILGGDDEVEGDALMRNALIQRIEPVGRVRTSADDLPAAEAVAVADAGAARSGEELVQGACAACHVAGVAGAPKLDDEAAWAERREAGLEALVASVVNGKGSMPARGGSDYSDEEIELAVQHIALFEVEQPAAEAPAADAAADADAAPEAEAETDADAGTAAAADAPASEQAAADDTAEASAQAPADEPADTDASAAGQQPAGDEAAAAPEAAEGEATQAAGAAITPMVVGEAPANLPDHVKSTVDGLCAGCHIAGVANAPKIGDTDAWQARADLGVEALSASVINGKGVMPARGGSTLTDEEIPIAIQYLMSK